MYAILEKLEQIERRLDSPEYRGGRVSDVKAEQIFDSETFISFKVLKDTSKKRKLRGKHPCVLAIKRNEPELDVPDRLDMSGYLMNPRSDLDIYWYSYREKQFKTAVVTPYLKSGFLSFLLEKGQQYNKFTIEDDVFERVDSEAVLQIVPGKEMYEVNPKYACANVKCSE